MPQSSATAFLRRHAPFLLIVCAPTLVTAFYFLLFASPQYVSEAQFVVRGQSSQPANPLAHLMEGGGGGADENTYAVQDFLMSRDAAQELIASQNLRDAFNTPKADALARFPNFYSRGDFEHFWWYYQRHIIAELDTTTGLSTLTVRTFSPNDSQKIARALIVSAESLINRMNIRQRENTIHASQMEVQNAEGRLRDISKQIDEYRNQQALLDPNKQSLPMLQQITSLENALIATRLQVSQLHNSAPNSPLIPVYTHRADILEKQIAELRTHITGSGTSMVPKISDYDALDLQRKIIEKELATATAELDRSRAQANRQLLYLDEVTHPNLPDYPTYPKALASIFVVFGTMFGLYAIGKLIVNGAREHQLI